MHFSVFIVIFCFVFFIALVSYFEIKKSLSEELSVYSQRMSEALTDTVSDIEHHLLYIGKSITSTQSLKSQNHYASFVQEQYKVLQNHYDSIGVTFEWFTPNFHLIRNHDEATHPNEILINENIEKCIKIPWKLFLISLQRTHNDLRQLHGGMGIIDSQGEYHGTIGVKFSAASFVRNLSTRISSPYIVFFFIDINNQVVLKSNDINYISDVYSLSKTLNETPRFSEKLGLIDKSFTFEKIKYLYYQKLPEAPYTLVLGVSWLFLAKIYFLKVLNYFLLLAIIVIINVVLIYKNRKKNQLQLIRSYETFKNYILDIKTHWNEALIVINFYCQLLKKQKNSNTITLDDYEIINQIQSLSTNLWQNRTYKKFSNQSITSIVHKGIDIKTPDALAKNIQIKSTFSQNIPPVYVDEHAIVQAIVELLEFCIGYSPPGQKIFVETIHTLESFYITFTHCGTSIDLDNLDRITKKFKSQRLNLGIELIGCCFSNIKKIIQAHGGTLSVISQKKEQNTFKIEVPYDHFKEQKSLTEESIQSPNVIQFKKS